MFDNQLASVKPLSAISRGCGSHGVLVVGSVVGILGLLKLNQDILQEENSSQAKGCSWKGRATAVSCAILTGAPFHVLVHRGDHGLLHEGENKYHSFKHMGLYRSSWAPCLLTHLGRILALSLWY